MNLHSLINDELDRLHSLLRSPSAPDKIWIMGAIQDYNELLLKLLKESNDET